MFTRRIWLLYQTPPPTTPTTARLSLGRCVRIITKSTDYGSSFSSFHLECLDYPLCAIRLTRDYFPIPRYYSLGNHISFAALLPSYLNVHFLQRRNYRSESSPLYQYSHFQITLLLTYFYENGRYRSHDAHPIPPCMFRCFYH